VRGADPPIIGTLKKCMSSCAISGCVFAVQVMLYLLALKLTWPDSVQLLRGNHE
jgi:hypothetical protein